MTQLWFVEIHHLICKISVELGTKLFGSFLAFNELFVHWIFSSSGMWTAPHRTRKRVARAHQTAVRNRVIKSRKSQMLKKEWIDKLNDKLTWNEQNECPKRPLLISKRLPCNVTLLYFLVFSLCSNLSVIFYMIITSVVKSFKTVLMVAFHVSVLILEDRKFCKRVVICENLSCDITWSRNST